MANTKSAKKAARLSEKFHLRNRAVKSATRTSVSKALSAVGGEDVAAAQAAVTAAASTLDRAARKGVIHPNNAARRKSRLMKRLNAASS